MAFFDFLHIFTDLFNSAEKAWHKLEPEVQDSLIKGSGIIEVINKNIESTPDEVFELIQKKFPDVTKEKLEAGLQKVSEGFGIATDVTNTPDLQTLITNIQKYLSSLKGKFWESASSIAAQLLSIFFAPDETPFAKVVQFIEYAYRKIILKQ